MPPAKPTCVFFDVDNTVVRGHTGYYAARLMAREGQCSLRQLSETVFWRCLHYFGVLDYRRLVRRVIRPYIGTPAAELEAFGEHCFADAIRDNIFLEAREIIDSLLAEGTVVCLISSSSPYLVEPVRRHLGIPHAITTRLVTTDGCLTGEVAGTVCYREGKTVLAGEFLNEQGMDVGDAAFYSDSISDLPLLESVGMPIATNPDIFLRRVARKRAWAVRTFAGTIGEMMSGEAAKNSRPR